MNEASELYRKDLSTGNVYECILNVYPGFHLSNGSLISHLFRYHSIVTETVRDAMLATDRAFYVPGDWKNPAAIYNCNKSLRIRKNSKPIMYAFALENCLKPILKAQKEGRDATVLVVGSGSGYLLGAFGRIGKTKVVCLEHVKEYYDIAVKNFQVGFLTLSLKRFNNFFQADSENDPDLRNRVEIRHTNGKFGWLKNTAEDIYDVIHIGISFPEDLSKENWKQLRVGGRIVSENADISPRRKMSFSDGFKGKSKKSEIRIL